ncbi:MAG: galactonate dehydratase, partial [Chloroflexota bacterium]
MKIVAIDNLLMRVERQNWHFVKITTDEGITGIGEASVEGRERTVAAAVDEFGRYLIGEDPGPIEHHWQRLHRHGFWRGGIILNSAISGIEQALWDIKGKKLGAPVYELLGGPTRNRVQVYTHANGPTPEATVEMVLGLMEKGYRAFKLGTGQPGPEGMDERTLIRQCAKKIEAVRAAVGPDVHLALDNHGRFSPFYAIELMHALQPYNMLFLEELVPPENLQALKKVMDVKANVPLATGERLFSKWEFRELIDQQIVDIVQPDICHAGGILELKKIAAMAEAYYIKVAPHNPNGPVATAASLHLSAAIPNFLILETAMNEPHRTMSMKYGPKIENGWIELPKTPGLGIELDEDVIRAHPYSPRDYSSAYYPDGSVA